MPSRENPSVAWCKKHLLDHFLKRIATRQPHEDTHASTHWWKTHFVCSKCLLNILNLGSCMLARMR